MGLFVKLREPIVLKADSDAEKQLRQLKNCLKTAASADKTKIQQDITFVQYGMEGEKSVLFELKNSHMPMYIMHDIYLKYGELSTQIDFLVITKKLVLVIECKNLFGDISINKQGDFSRVTNADGKIHREGMYSPYTQNQRHLELIHEMRRAEKNALTRAIFDKHFYETHKSLIVLANPKTIINMRYAPEEIQKQVIKADNLINCIKKLHEESNASEMADKEMKALADFFLKHHTENPVDYTKKYQKQEKQPRKEIKEVKKETKKPSYLCPNCKKPVSKSTYGWYCTGKCGMKLTKVYGTELSESQVISLLSGKSITCTTKTGQTTVLPQTEKNEYKGNISYQWKTRQKRS